MRPVSTCRRCHKIRPVSLRGLCRPCSVRIYQTGTLHEWPALTQPRRTLQEFALDFAILEARDMSYLEICRTMGYSMANDGATLRVMIVRARKAGLLPRDRPPLCGWSPQSRPARVS